MAGIFSTGAAISLSITKELRRLNAILDSVKAFYAADAGVEWKFYSALKDPVAEKPIFLNDASCCGDGDIQLLPPQGPGRPVRIKSIGVSPVNGALYIVKRSIETNTNW